MTDVGRNSVNEANSPIFDILNTANKVGLLNTVEHTMLASVNI